MRVVEVVHLVVPGRNRTGEPFVLVHERPEDLARQERREAAHLGQSRSGVEIRHGCELAGLLRDRRGVVAHPLQVVRHVVERQ